MAQPNNRASGAAFLRGGGATGALIATHDWSSTSLGPLSAWPSTLKTATAIVLRSPMPMTLLWGHEGVMIYNDACAVLGGERHPQALGANVRAAWPELADFHASIMQAVFAGEALEFRDQMLTLSRSGKPEQLWFNLDYSPVPDENGEIVAVLAVVVETTDQVRTQAAVEESRGRLSAALAIARLGVFEADLETRTVTFDDRAREIYQFGPDEPLTFDYVDRRMDRADFQRIMAEGAAPVGQTRWEREFRIHLPDGSIRDLVSLSDRVRGPDGRTSRIVGVLDDVTERRRAEQRQRLMINELNHRVKNTLATVQSIAAQTLRSAADVTSAREAFEARLVALAAAHDLLTAESWRGARLTDVAASAMAPFEMTQRPQISRSGPPVWLTSPRALALSMALHELATNAAKYGALSHPHGRVLIDWRMVDGDSLVLSWTEEGGPPVSPPTHSGFGTRLLQRSLIRELQGAVVVTFDPKGVRCEIRCLIEDVGLFEPP